MTDQIICEVLGHLGVITLNRPKALNALTGEMCEAMTKILLAWQDDERIGAVLVRGSGERAFCAGGDIIMLHDSGKARDGRAEKFWRAEYRLNELIHRYAKPYIALIDGIVMGGGVGVSVHGRLRIAGDNTLFAMPETGIGYFPDVGGTYFLPRLGTAIGNYLGLTGARLKTAAACGLGVANGYVPTDQHDDLVAALGRADLDGSDMAVSKIIGEYVVRPPSKGADLPDTVHCFDRSSVVDIERALETDGSDWAIAQLKALRSKSPLAVRVTFEALKRGARMDFKTAMSQELDLSLAFLTTQDFYEGIRAAVIDKDRNPKWSCDGFSKVNGSEITRQFRSAKPMLKFID